MKKTFKKQEFLKLALTLSLNEFDEETIKEILLNYAKTHNFEYMDEEETPSRFDKFFEFLAEETEIEQTEKMFDKVFEGYYDDDNDYAFDKPNFSFLNIRN